MDERGPASGRRSAMDPTAAIKCTSRAFYELALAEAQAARADDALILDEAGQVLETTIGNVFFVAGGRLHTPRATGALLPGIARRVLLTELAAAGTPAREAEYALADLLGSDGVIVTNAVHGPRPAVLPDGPQAPDVGPLRELWQKALRAAAGSGK